MSEILKDWLDGNGLPDCLVIDGHIHIGTMRPPFSTTFFQTVDETVERANLICDQHGVDAFCTVGGGYMVGGSDYRLGNDFLLKVWKKMPDRLIPFMSLNPNDSFKNLKAELDRMTGEGICCIKLINAYQENYPGDGPNLMKVYEYAAEHNMIVFNHSWSIVEIELIAKQFPESTFIFAHYNNRQDPILKKFNNVCANTWSYSGMEFIDRGVNSVGAGKLMLGSDGFFNSLSVGIGSIVFADISDKDKRQILGLNIAVLLDRVGALPDKYRKFVRRNTLKEI